MQSELNPQNLRLNNMKQALAFLNKVSEQELSASSAIEKQLNLKCSDEADEGGPQCFMYVDQPTEEEKAAYAWSEITKAQGYHVIYKKKSDPKTKLSIQIMSSARHKNYVQVRERLPLNKVPFSLKDLIAHKNTQDKFEQYYIQRCDKHFGISISIEDLECKLVKSQNHIECIWKTNQGENLKDFIKINGSQYQIQIHHLFEHLYLSPQDFNPKGNINFGKYKNKGRIYKRGNWPYYQPTAGIRFGLEVGIYGRDQTWLSMSGKNGEWAACFHGVGSPDEIIPSNNNTKLKNIIKQKFKAGPRQRFRNHIAVNKNQKIKNGVYLTPHFQTAAKYTTAVQILDKYYIVILQCRVRPESILVCPQREDYWVINNPDDIRCYGIILIDDIQARQYDLSPENTHGQIFKYEKWKNRINGLCK